MVFSTFSSLWVPTMLIFISFSVSFELLEKEESLDVASDLRVELLELVLTAEECRSDLLASDLVGIEKLEAIWEKFLKIDGFVFAGTFSA
jgi:hypothetical protein